MPTQNKKAKWKLSKLKEHPQQAVMFGAIPDEELKALAADMKKRGQRDAVELIMQTPVVVQQAFDRGELPLVTAGKVALLMESDQREIARRIREGEKAGRVVADFLISGKQAEGDGDAAFRRLVRALRREVPQLAERVRAIRPQRLARCQDILTEASALLIEILKRRGA